MISKPHEYRIKILDEELKLFNKYKKGKFLEVFSGDRRNVLALQELGFDVEEINKISYNKFKFKDNFFDVVYSYQYINHNYKEKIEKIFKESYRVLKPKGLFSLKISDMSQFNPELVKGNKYKETELDAGFTTSYFEKVAPQTFIKLDGEEKGIVHYAFFEDELKESLEKIGFKIVNIRKIKWNLVVNCKK